MKRILSNRPGIFLGILVLAGTGVCRAATIISVNFEGSPSSQVTGPAGVQPADHFTNITGASGSSLNLVDNSNAATTADLSFTGGFGYRENGTPGSQNGNLLKGFLASTGTITLSLSQIPFSSYDVYVYLAVDSGGRTANISNGTTTYTYQAITNPNNVFVGATNTTGGTTGGGGFTIGPAANYALFSGMTGASFTITNYRTSNSEFGPGQGIAGFQIVDASAVPEPSTWAMVLGGLGLLMILAARSRAKEIS